MDFSLAAADAYRYVMFDRAFLLFESLNWTFLVGELCAVVKKQGKSVVSLDLIAETICTCH